MNLGKYFTADESYPFEEMPQWVYASTAIPGAMPYHNFHDMTLIDGGALVNLDVITAVERCREIADSDDEISVDIIFIQKLDDDDCSQKSTIGILLRTVKFFLFSLSDYSMNSICFWLLCSFCMMYLRNILM
jgi:hypothetical protein